MPRGIDQRLLQDLDRFEVVASHLAAGPRSFRWMGEKFRPVLSPGALIASIARLEDHFGVKLVLRAEGTAEENQLTEEGRRLLDRIAVLLSWRPKAENMELRVEVSHSLLTSQALSPAIAAFVERVKQEHGPRLNLGLGLRTEMDFRRICKDLETGDLTMALTWGFEQRLQGLDQVVSEPIGPEFDIVLISHSQKEIEAITKTGGEKPDLSPLANNKVIMMPQGSQPLQSLLQQHQPNLEKGGSWMVVDTIDSVIALVAARVGTFAIVPAIYPVLDRYHREDQLFWSKPIWSDPERKKLRIHLFTKAPGLRKLPPIAQEFVEEIDKGLKAYRNHPAWIDLLPPSEFPMKPAFYEGLKWGYYVDHDRKPDKRGTGQPKWREETVKLQHDNKLQADQRLLFTGPIENMHGDRFHVDAELFERLFIVKAKQGKDDGTSQSVNSFVSVFNWCSPDKGGVICGTWSGDFQGRPTMYATVFSATRLSLAEVYEYSRHGRQRTLLAVETGAGF
jgi:DNA-binding transcriptional LysR family regulator